MATIAEVVGYVIAAVALPNTLVQIISYLSDEEYRVQLGTWIRDRVSNLRVPAPAPAPVPVPNHITNNQTYNYRLTFTQPYPVTINLGNGQAPAFNQIQGPRPDQIADQAAPDTGPSNWLPEDAW